MAKVIIDGQAPQGGQVIEATAELLSAANKFARLKAACALAVANGGTLDAGNGGAAFGGAPGSHNDYNYALNAVADAIAAFMAANAGPIAQLDQGVTI